MTALTFPVSNERVPVTVTRGRNAAQRAAVAAIVAGDRFDFAIDNPFTSPVCEFPDGRVVGGNPLSGPFLFTWYDTDRQLHTARVESDGATRHIA